MSRERKKQFSLSLIVIVFLVATALISIGVFINSVMYYNQLNKEAEELERSLTALYETRVELEDMLGSSEELNKLLSDYRRCQEVLASGTAEGEILDQYQRRMSEVKELLNSSKNKDYISRIAKDELNLYFADEKIFRYDGQ